MQVLTELNKPTIGFERNYHGVVFELEKILNLQIWSDPIKDVSYICDTMKQNESELAN